MAGTTTETTETTEAAKTHISELRPQDPSKARLPPFFPAVRSECKEESTKFFYCFQNNSQPISDNDAGRARRGLVNCWQLMKSYERCMISALKTAPVPAAPSYTAK